MKYHFGKSEQKAMRDLNIPFDFLSELNTEQELQLIEIISNAMDDEGYSDDGSQSELGELYGDILTHMAQQAK